MELILDSAVIEEVEEIASWGVLDGVTTNPTLIRRSGGNFEETIRSIATICSGPISAEVTGMSTSEMVKEGLDLKGKLPENVIIKIPCTPEGLSATRTLADHTRVLSRSGPSCLQGRCILCISLLGKAR